MIPPVRPPRGPRIVEGVLAALLAMSLVGNVVLYRRPPHIVERPAPAPVAVIPPSSTCADLPAGGRVPAAASSLSHRRRDDTQVMVQATLPALSFRRKTSRSPSRAKGRSTPPPTTPSATPSTGWRSATWSPASTRS
ncbi:MAG: hypothetical protein IPF99_36255 [Deltaproteobacteria bacterium]|nr:hypothetical protein [Deltaproteobacteria bacterium]